MRRKRILATGGIVTTLLLGGMNPSRAQAADTQQNHSQYVTSVTNVSETYDEEEIGASYLDKDFDSVESGRDYRTQLEEQGFTPAQIHKLVNY